MTNVFHQAKAFSQIVASTLRWTRFALKHAPLNPENRFLCTRGWGSDLVTACRLEVQVEGNPVMVGPCIMMSNHLSYLDIPLLMSLAPVTFLSKAEIAKWPVFGPGATSVGTIYVNRESRSSRGQVASHIRSELETERKVMALFPEGTSSIKRKPWKKGAMQIAQDCNVPVQAVRLFFEPVRETSFIDDDALVPHLWNLLGLPKIRAHVKFFEPVMIQDAKTDLGRIEQMVTESYRAKLKEIGYSET